MQDKSLIEMLREMRTSLDNMNVMGMELCRAMGMDMGALLESLDADSEASSEELLDVGEEM